MLSVLLNKMHFNFNFQKRIKLSRCIFCVAQDSYHIRCINVYKLLQYLLVYLMPVLLFSINFDISC